MNYASSHVISQSFSGGVAVDFIPVFVIVRLEHVFSVDSNGTTSTGVPVTEVLVLTTW